jgi:Ca-activated chloride channel family protein
LLLTDGRTYGDQPQSLDLANKAAAEGISISAMGLGHDWNDEFLDQIASKTGGTSEYISSAGAVVGFLNDHVRRLSNAFADRIKLTIAPDSDVVAESAFKLLPNAQPIEIQEGEVIIGSMQPNRPISVLLQLSVNADIQQGFRSLMRLTASGDIMDVRPIPYATVSDLSIDVTPDDSYDEPPAVIMDALSRLTLYRLQERANEAMDRGDVIEATRRLEHLATRLLAMGEEELANDTLNEVRRISMTQGFSDEGRKTIKYSTRLLISDKKRDS